MRTVEDLDQPTLCDDSAFRLASARLAFLDRDAVLADFPALRGCNGDDLAAWMLEHGAIIGERQAAQSDVNTPITTTGGRLTAHRPPAYGRALVIRAPGGLLDVKGCGVAPDRTPTTALHGNGLVQLGEALQELATQRLLDSIFARHTGASLAVLPIYAVIDAGFDARTGDGGTVPAGLVVRRAHRRSPGGDDLPRAGTDEAAVRLAVELELRRHGVTSCNNGTLLRVAYDDRGATLHHGEHAPVRLDTLSMIEQQVIGELAGWGMPHETRRFEYLNVQLVRGARATPRIEATVVDFGHYKVRTRFDAPLVNAVRGRILRWGGVVAPGDARFVQPDPDLVVDRDAWEGLRWWRLADALRAGAVARSDVEQIIETLGGKRRA